MDSTAIRMSPLRGTALERSRAKVIGDDLQGAVNLIAVLTEFRDTVKDLRDRDQLYGDALNNHPLVLACVSKLVAITRLTPSRESAAFAALTALQDSSSELPDYEVIPV